MKHAALVVLLMWVGLAQANGFDDPFVKPLQSLEERGFDTSTPSLRRLIVDQAQEVDTRYFAMLLLAERDDTESIPALGALLFNPSEEIAASAAHSLSILSDPKSEQYLVDFLGSAGNKMAKNTAIFALASLGSESAVSEILRIAKDTQSPSENRVAAIGSLGYLARNTEIEDGAFAAELNQLLGDLDLSVKAAAAHSLYESGTGKPTRAMVEIATNADVPLHVRAPLIDDLQEISGLDFNLFSESNGNGQGAVIRRIETWFAETPGMQARESVDVPSELEAQED